MNSPLTTEQIIERGMFLAKECANKRANAANWLALRAHLERMTRTIPGGSWHGSTEALASPRPAEPAGEPVAWISRRSLEKLRAGGPGTWMQALTYAEPSEVYTVPLYAAPPSPAGEIAP